MLLCCMYQLCFLLILQPSYSLSLLSYLPTPVSSYLTLPYLTLPYLTLLLPLPPSSSHPFTHHHVPQALEPHLGFGRPMIGESKPLSNSNMVRTFISCTYDPHLSQNVLLLHFNMISYTFGSPILND